MKRLAATILAAGLALPSCQTPTGTTQDVPLANAPLPPSFYDPNSGPYFVALNASGQLFEDSSRHLATVLEGWQGEDRQAFLICVIPGQETDDIRPETALASVSDALKALGADAIIADGRQFCEAAIITPPEGVTYVQLTGVNRP